MLVRLAEKNPYERFSLWNNAIKVFDASGDKRRLVDTYVIMATATGDGIYYQRAAEYSDDKKETIELYENYKDNVKIKEMIQREDEWKKPSVKKFRMLKHPRTSLKNLVCLLWVEYFIYLFSK